jgi:glucose-1-phosphate thymidylyltransferase
MKGIILAGGFGTRLFPLTKVVSKHLLPVYDKPMIYYPLSTLMMAGIRDILVISTPSDLDKYRALLGDGAQLGLKIEYVLQPHPKGVAEALIIGKSFTADENFALILADNIFFGSGLGQSLSELYFDGGSLIFGYKVSNPSDYGVVLLDKSGSIISLEEKPSFPKSDIAIPGFYFFDKYAYRYATEIQASSRGELEIVSILNKYLNNDTLNIVNLPRGTTWMDAGTIDALLESSLFVRSIEQRQGFKISCPEEIAWRNNWISNRELGLLAIESSNVEYKKYLLSLLGVKEMYTNGLRDYK